MRIQLLSVRAMTAIGATAATFAVAACVPPTPSAPTTTSSTTLPPSPVTVHTPVAMTCRAVAPIGQTSYDVLDSGVTAEYPEQVGPGDTFQVKVTADPIEAPTAVGGSPIAYLHAIRIRVAVPAGTTYVDSSWAGGSNIGSGTPSVAHSGDVVTLTVPGNLAPGTTALLPTVTITLQASGAPGSAIQAQLSGSSYDIPSISFVARLSSPVLVVANVPSDCYAPENPILATIDIT